MRIIALGLIAACGALGPRPASARDISFDLLGTSETWQFEPRVSLSADGRTVAAQGWTWSREGGYRNFSREPGLPSNVRVTAMSRDGRTIAGTYGTSAFRYRGPGTFESVGTGSSGQSGTSIIPTGVSNDGSCLSGFSRRYDFPGFEVDIPLYWDHSNVALTVSPSNSNTFLAMTMAISGDGGTVAGYSFAYGTAWTWRPGGDLQVLAAPGGGGSSRAGAISADGTMVAGSTRIANLDVAVLWREGVGELLGLTPGFGSCWARSMNSEGSVITFGLAPPGSTSASTAGVWTRGTGVIPLSEYLRGAGVSLPEGWRLADCTGVSDDGLTFVGTALDASFQSRPFVAVIPSPGGLAVLGLLGIGRRRRERKS